MELAYFCCTAGECRPHRMTVVNSVVDFITRVVYFM